MKYCKSCGKELADDAVICTGCGCATDDYYAKQSPAKKSDEMSTMALLGFIFSFISPIVGLILSCIAHKTALAEEDQKSKTFSKAGIIISSVAIGVGAVSCVISIILGVVYGIGLVAIIGGAGGTIVA